MIRNKKLILFLIVILVFVYIIIAIFPVIFTGKKYSKTVFIGDYTKVIVNNNIEVINENSQVGTQKVKVLFKDKLIEGTIKSEKSDFDKLEYHYSVYNKEGDKLSFNSALLAYTTDLLIKIKNSTRISSKDMEDINNYLKLNNYSIAGSIELDYLYINSFDLEGNGKEENIYSVGLIEKDDEIDDSENNNKNYYSFVFMKKNDKYILIDKEEDEYDAVSNIRLDLYNIVDFNNDGDYEFVISKMMSEYGPNYYELYSFDGSKFTIIGGE